MTETLPTPSPQRILVVDDDAAARGALLEILAVEGYAVETASDGLAALAKVAAFQPDIVLCDLGMPGMDGVTFIKKANQLGQTFRLAIMSASYGGRDVAMSLGADYLPKPIDLGRLFEVVSHLSAPLPGVPA